MIERRILLVEGRDDLNVLAHILKAHGLEGKIHIRDQEGVEKLKGRLETDLFASLLQDLAVELKGSSIKALGLIVDADLDVAARWDSLVNRLQVLGYDGLPRQPQADGVVLSGDENLPPLGFWLMPDNSLPGALEDFVKMLVPAERANLWQRAVEAVTDIPAVERRFGNKIAKAQIHTYLAWQERPGVPLGIAIRERFLAPDAPQTASLVAWLRKLFQL